MSMTAESVIAKVRHEFNKYCFDTNWITSSYTLVFNNPSSDVQNDLNQIIVKKSMTEINAIKSLYTLLKNQVGSEEVTNMENEEKYKFELFEKTNKEKVVALPPHQGYINDRTYSDILEQMLKTKFKQFDEVTSIYGIINQACELYDQEDNIDKLTFLLNSSNKVKELICKKKNQNYVDRANFEYEIINLYNQERMEELEYTTICIEPLIKCLYNETSIKLIVSNRLDDCNIQKLVCMLNYKDSIQKWFPFIAESKTLTIFSETKSIYYIRSEIPIIQDRELYLYGFLDNNLLEKGKIIFYAKSADNINSHQPEDIFARMFKTFNIDEIQRIYANCLVFEINVLSNNEATIEMFVDINHHLKFVNVQLVEVICKQICKQFSDKIKSICESKNGFDKFLPSNPNDHQLSFQNYYSNLIPNFYQRLDKGYTEIKQKYKYNIEHKLGEKRKNPYEINDVTNSEKGKNIFDDINDKDDVIIEEKKQIKANQSFDLDNELKELDNKKAKNHNDEADALSVKDSKNISRRESSKEIKDSNEKNGVLISNYLN